MSDATSLQEAPAQTQRPRFAGSRIVVKVGSSSVSGDNASQIPHLADSLAKLHRAGCQVILVSSGAISTGVPFLQLDEDVYKRQAQYRVCGGEPHD